MEKEAKHIKKIAAVLFITGAYNGIGYAFKEIALLGWVYTLLKSKTEERIY